ncbi:hypothetical protein GUITHDRAFT_113999 [Guillardia theta CCMP2712]|uniref:Fibronectin type-III domain-containing protein n=1 Tax=Guillardia theta (strain CCMP2712) TaxID=905079 RepID=L1IUR4_GUITC|nr:hypothetical protein GUITHDRAFT_113999 [Guillardia theta CCMP2712]EKX40006.1 hypothetical protein GUITHDRAFT_113999 [Guillardia theta CCMP2712]|eukprot:XP_005826986.1 hypothetical protein GUITHDRAFT_113999 [Guillardia theta CCMP2712]
MDHGGRVCAPTSTRHEGVAVKTISSNKVQLDGGAAEQDGAYVGDLMMMGGESRRIISYSSERVVVVDPPFSSSEAGGQSYVIVRVCEVGALSHRVGHSFAAFGMNVAGVSSASLQFVIPAPVNSLLPVRTQNNKVEVSWSKSDMSNFFSVSVANLSSANASNPSAYHLVSVVGPGGSSYTLDTSSIPWLLNGRYFTVAVFAAVDRAGPFEKIGKHLHIFTAAGVPLAHSIATLRVMSKTETSFQLRFDFNLSQLNSDRPPMHICVEVCQVSSLNASCRLYPNGSFPADLQQAKKFYPQSGESWGEAEILSQEGFVLSQQEGYRIQAYAGNLYDDNGDGLVLGEEGFTLQPVQASEVLILGPLPPPVSDLKVKGTGNSLVKLAWSRTGAGGSLSSSYLVEVSDVSVSSSSSWQPARLVAARVTGLMLDATHARFLSPVSSHVGRSFTSAPYLGRSLTGTLLQCSSSSSPGQEDCRVSISSNVSFGLGQEEEFAVLLSEEEGHGWGLEGEKTYAFRVRAGNLNVLSFEQEGSNLVSCFTVLRPPPVSSLALDYLLGEDGAKLSWNAGGGGRMCERVEFEVDLSSNASSYSDRHRVALLVSSLLPSTYSVNVSGLSLGLSYRISICSRCQLQSSGLSPPFIDGDSLACSRSNEVLVTMTAKPSGPILGVAIVAFTSTAIRIGWQPKEHVDRYKVRVLVYNESVLLQSFLYQFPPPLLARFLPDLEPKLEDAVFQEPEAVLFLDPQGWGRYLEGAGAWFSFQVLGGSAHDGGEYSVMSEETPLYSLALQPELNYSLLLKTRTSATVSWSYREAGGLLDPQNHSQTLFSFSSLLLQAGSSWQPAAADRRKSIATADRGTWRSDQVVLEQLTDSGQLDLQVSASTIASSLPISVLGIFSVAQCPAKVNVTSSLCLSSSASAVHGAYAGLSLLVVRGDAMGFYDPFVLSYDGQERRLLLSRSPLSSSSSSNWVAIISIGSLPSSSLQTVVSVSGAVLHLSSVSSLTAGLFLRLASGKGRGEVRKVTSVSQAASSVTLSSSFDVSPELGDRFEVLNYSTRAALLLNVQLHGPPLAPVRLSSSKIFSASILLQWTELGQCQTKTGSVSCNITSALLQARETHSSRDFYVNAPWPSIEKNVSISVPGQALFTGLDPLSSYEVRVATRAAGVLELGAVSQPFAFKLTDIPPDERATIGDLTDSSSSSSVTLSWTIPGTLNPLAPPYVSKFKIAVGQDAASLLEYRDSTGAVLLLDRIDVCVYPIELARHSYTSNAAGIECRVTLTGLPPATILLFKIFCGNDFGFEQQGATSSLNRSNSSALLSWSRPLGWPQVTRYYVSYSQDNSSWTPAPGAAGARDIIVTENSTVQHRISELRRRTSYYFRVHVGGQDGVDGFYPDTVLDPTTSNVVSVLIADVPSRPVIGVALPSPPDRNSVLQLSWSSPIIDSPVSSYLVRVWDCGSGTSPACSSTPALFLSPAQQVATFLSSPAQLTGLKRGTWYQLQVAAQNLAGQGAWSDNSSLVRTLSLPSAVSHLNVSQLNPNSVVLSWSPSPGASSYKLVWSATQPLNPSFVLLTGDKTQYQHNFVFVNPLQVTYTIFAGDATAFEDQGRTVILPSAAQNFQITAGTQNSITFSWTPNPAANVFQIRFSRSPTFDNSRPAAPETSLTHQTVAGLLPDKLYFFKVFSRTSGATPYELFGSDLLNATASDLPLPLVSAAVTATSSSQVSLRWSPSPLGPRPTKFRVLWASQPLPCNGSLTASQFGNPLETEREEATITGLQLEQAIAIVVYAGNLKGFEQVGSSLLACVSPVAPVTQALVRGTSAGSQLGVTLNWRPPAEGMQPTSYRISASNRMGVKYFDSSDVLHNGARHSLQSAFVPLLQPYFLLLFSIHSRATSGFYEPAGGITASDDALLSAAAPTPSSWRVSRVSWNSVTFAARVHPQGANSSCFSARLYYQIPSLMLNGELNDFQLGCNQTSSWEEEVTAVGLSNNLLYLFDLRVLVGDAVFSPAILLPTLQASALDVPTSISVLGVTSSSVLLAWRPGVRGARVLEYVLEYYAMNASSSSIDETLVTNRIVAAHVGGPGEPQQLNVSSLSPAVKYAFFLRARSLSGWEAPPSASVSVTPIATPTDFAVTSVRGGEVVLSWASPRLDPYSSSSLPAAAIPALLVLLVRNSTVEQRVGPLAVSSSSVVVSGLTVASLYEFELLSLTSSGLELRSDPNRLLRVAPLPRPSNLSIAAMHENSVLLLCDVDLPAGSQLLLRVSSSLPQQYNQTCSLGQAQGSQQACQLTGLSPQLVYNITVSSMFLSSFDPLGVSILGVSPVELPVNASTCYVNVTEISLRWLAPSGSILPLFYRFSYSVNGGPELFYPHDIPADVSAREQRGSMFVSETLGRYAVSIHSVNPLTGLVSTIGSPPLIIDNTFGRGGDMLSLPRPCSGNMDEVRLWSLARDPLVLSTSLFDTVAVSSAKGLIGYWNFNNALEDHACIESLTYIRDEVTGQRSALLHGAKLSSSTIPIDRDPSVNVALTSGSVGQQAATSLSPLPLGGGEGIVVYFGGELRMAAAAADENPTDLIFFLLEVNNNLSSLPTGVVGQGRGGGNQVELNVTWQPLLRDAGKVLPMCLVLRGERRNPSYPFFRQQLTETRRCFTIFVPPCSLQVGAGEGLRSLGARFHVPWRTLFVLNNKLNSTGGVQTGQVLNFGKTFTIVADQALEDAISVMGTSWDDFINCNVKAVNTLLIKNSLSCPSLDYPQTCHALPLLKAGEVVVDVQYTDVERHAGKAEVQACFISRFHSSCL